MQECNKLSTCAFFQTYEEMEEKAAALRGFVRMYCKGDSMVRCKRKIIVTKFGSVPVNIMPNGYPLAGTNTQNWDAEIKAHLKKI
ncbi:MAG: hypothetical protein ACTSYI_17320 [Promethearchaeota archaeon]